LKRKGTELFSVPPYALVYDALREMAKHDIGALLVMQNGRLAGVLSERDYARKVILLGRSSTETEVREVMSPAVCVAPLDSVDSCLHLMTSARVRHVVVMDKDEVAGLVSIGDLVNWIISAQAETIDHLHSYIAIGYPG
jgi:CBS domain-containing protein